MLTANTTELDLMQIWFDSDPEQRTRPRHLPDQQVGRLARQRRRLLRARAG